MYAGEMCAWYVQTGPVDDEFDARTIGVDMLSTYIKAIQDIPQLRGWKTDRAKELLSQLKS